LTKKKLGTLQGIFIGAFCPHEIIMKAEIIDGNLVLTLPLEKPTPSASGKTLVVASTHGNQKTSVEVDGKIVTVGVNAYISNK
jgi:hypothetical protein